MTPQDLYCTDHHIQAPTVTAAWMQGYNARICILTWYLFTCIYYMFIFIVMLNWLWKMHKKTFKQQKIMELIQLSGKTQNKHFMLTDSDIPKELLKCEWIRIQPFLFYCVNQLMILQAALFSEFDIKVHSNLSSCSTESIREKYESILCIRSSFHSFISSNCFLEFPKLQEQYFCHCLDNC